MNYPNKHSFVVDAIKTGVYEPEVRDLIKKYVKKDMVVVDAGANIGYNTILLEELSKHVYAFEPNKEIFPYLKENTNAECFNMALMDYNGVTDFYKSDICTGMGRTFKSHLTTDKKDVVACVRLDDVVEHVDFIKMDIEGSEYKALKGMPRILETCKYIIFENNVLSGYEEGNEDVHKVNDLLKSFGFDIYNIHDDNYIGMK